MLMSSDFQTDQRPTFSITATLVFVFACACAAMLIHRHGNINVEELSPLDFAILGFACLRVIHLITYDKILDPLRERLKNGRGFTRLLAGFVSCLWCTGIWSALIVTTIYMLGTWGRLADWLLAVAGVGAMLQVISRVIAGCAVEPKE
jgi:hypothetical protein